MRILRIIATLVTGTVMVAGGIALTVTGPAAVVLLGGCTAVVGIAYLYAGLAAEHTHLHIATPQRPHDGGPWWHRRNDPASRPAARARGAT